MFEGAVAGILNRLLGKYVQDLDTENLNVGIFSGNVNLTDLKLKPEALYELDFPIDVKIGTIGRISFQIPWTALYTQPVVVHIDDVLVLVGPAISNSYFDPEREKRLMRAAKRKILQDLEAESEILKGPQNFFEHLFTAIVNNLQIYVRNVHVRYEDSISSKDGPLACGICLQSLSIETTNSKWKPSVTPENASTVYQMLRIESLSAYWNPTATVLDDAEIANITPMQYYNWKHYMLTGLGNFSMHHEGFDFLLKPVSCKVKLIMNRSSEARVPRLLLDAVLQDSALQLSRRQYLSIDNLLTSFKRIQLNRKYRHLHPGVPLSKDIRKWWRYAYNSVVEQRVRPYTWTSIKKHRENYNMYKKIYKSTLKSPNDIELKLDLQKSEDNLPIISVVIAREQAKFELISEEPDRIEVVESEYDWWSPTAETPSDSDTECPKKRVELFVKTERSRSLWSHLSSPEKKKVCELIGYVEGEPRKDKSKRYIEHKLNLTLANCSLTLMNRGKEILVLTLTQFLASLETRPSAQAYKLSCRTESILIEGISSDGELVPMVTAVSSSSLLALDVERRPASSEADYALTWLMEPLELVYVEHAITELINILQIHSSIDLPYNTSIFTVPNLMRLTSRRTLLQLNVDLKAINLQYANACVPSRILIVDLTRVTIKSDLQPSQLALEDATCMELEERLYDRLHAECSLQVIFCESTENWQEMRRHADSELHLIPRVKAQLVFSNSIKKEYKLLPRYKLNISLSSVKLNLSDRVIGSALDFLENLPLPSPNTVAVSFLDSGDYCDEIIEEDMLLDKVEPDPGYRELVALRRRIVAACLSKNRPESTIDKVKAQASFHQSSLMFTSSDHSEEELEIYARTVDLPGFDDNVSPSNTINTLLRFVVGEVVINLARSMDQVDRPYLMLSISKICLDVALMEYGPALQFSIGEMLLTDKQHHTSDGQYLELITTSGELLNVIYRKVRCDCPEFRSHFHGVEAALVGDVGGVRLALHAPAVRAALLYAAHVASKVISRRGLEPRACVAWVSSQRARLARADERAPPVPPGATKFSYSVRVSSLSVKLCHSDSSLIEIRLAMLESDCVFRANDKLVFKMALNSIHVDDLSDTTLYSKLVWPDEDKVLEAKYVAGGALRVRLGRLHVVLAGALHAAHQFLEPLMPSSAVSSSLALDKYVDMLYNKLKSDSNKTNLAIELHAPVLLIPQKASSPDLLVLSMGDLTIENFFKPLPLPAEVVNIKNAFIDNILVKWENITLCRAVMTLAGTLELQEPILEPLSIRSDIKRALCYQQLLTLPAYRQLLLIESDIVVDAITINLGQRDLATICAVLNNCWPSYIGGVPAGSPVEVSQSDASVTKLEQFLAQGEPVRREVTMRCSVEGFSVQLFADGDEALSSPVRQAAAALAALRGGEAAARAALQSDGALDASASLHSLLLEDVSARPTDHAAITRIFQSAGNWRNTSSMIAVSRAPLLEAVLRVRRARRRSAAAPAAPAAPAPPAPAAAASLDIRLDRARLNLALPFLIKLLKAVEDALPGDKSTGGGVVNPGYVDAPSDTSGYCSQAMSLHDDASSLAISIQLCQPEIMFFTDSNKTDGHALLLRTELNIDYSSHSNTENLVVTLSNLQIMSKLQSKLQNLPPQMVLRPCDVEFSKCFKNVEEGVKAKLTFSEVEVHIAPSTVHTVIDIIDEVTNELTIPDDKYMFNFANYNPKSEKEDLWSPKKISPPLPFACEDSYVLPRYCGALTENCSVVLPSVKVMFEVEQAVRVPVGFVELSFELHLQEWSTSPTGVGSLTLSAFSYNEKINVWEPVIEPVVVNENECKPWELNFELAQGESHLMSTRLEINQPSQPDTDIDGSISSKKSRKKPGFDSETSADEAETDSENIIIRNPYGKKSFNEYDVGMNVDFEMSDDEDEGGLMDKLSTAVGHLFTDDSSSSDASDDEHSSEHSASEHEDDKAVSFADGIEKDSVDDKPDNLQDPPACSYWQVRSSHALQLSLAAGAWRGGVAFCRAVRARRPPAAALLHAPAQGTQLVNDIGPGSTVHLRTKAETDLAGNDKILAVADYDVDPSRPSTPGSVEDILEEAGVETKEEPTDIGDDWECFEGGFPTGGPPSPMGLGGGIHCGPLTTQQLEKRIMDETLAIKLHDFDDLVIPCPQRTMSKLHVLHPSKNNTRYYIVVERTSDYCSKTIVVRSPLQIRNETSYPLELYYDKTCLANIASEHGRVSNPFASWLKVTVLAPSDTYNVPLYVANHARIFILPVLHENYQISSEGIWWVELGKDLGSARDITCRGKEKEDSLFALRVLAEEGCKSPNITRSIPNYLLRVVPPLAIYNRLPFSINIASNSFNSEIFAGDRAYVYTVKLADKNKVELKLSYLGIQWTGGFVMTPDVTDKTLHLTTDSETDSNKKNVSINVRIDRLTSWEMYVYSPYWVVNKTQLPLQIKASNSEALELAEGVSLWRGGGGAGGGRWRARVPPWGWSRAARLPPAAPAPLAAPPRYPLAAAVTLSELCPQLTKIMTFLPQFLIYNDTRRHLRFMEEDEAADLWLDVAPSQVSPLCGRSRNKRAAMRLKYRDSTRASSAFHIDVPHYTVLRMDKGSAICVDVSGGTTGPFIVTFKTYTPGDAPVRVDNLCDDLFLKLHQEDCGQVALLSPYQSLLYTWDDSTKDRKLLWNIYNNKGKGFYADFLTDGYGEEKVCFHSVKNSTLVATNSVTSKLSSTLKKLTPKSPEPCSSSSDDSDSSGVPEVYMKAKKMRKDKVVVYWISYMEGYQRVFVLTQDERIAYQYRMKINSERSNYEVCLSLPSVAVSVCIDSKNTVKELAYISVADSIPRWEVNVSNKWKQLTPELTTWIEDKYQTDQRKCQIKDYVHIDLEKMQMTKPFFAELRRSYNPGVWMHLRKSDTYTYCHLKLQSLQIDNQLHEAVFPSVLHPSPLSQDLKSKHPLKPSIELLALKQHRPTLNQDIYKYLKILVQEYNVNLDRGFVNHVFDMLNHWKMEEKPAVRLRADLQLVHMPLPVIAMKSQTNAQRNVLFEYVHLSPIKLSLSLSSRGYSEDNAGTSSYKYGNKENRPKLFNSDLLEYLFNSWGSSLCDMKDVVLRMPYFEARNMPISTSSVMEQASSHYWLHLIQQFYVLVLGLNILGNPYVGDFTKGLKQYYEPWMGSIGEVVTSCFEAIFPRSRPTSVTDTPRLRGKRRPDEDLEKINDLPRSVIERDSNSPASIALALTGLIARPSLDICRMASKTSFSKQLPGAAPAHHWRRATEGRVVSRRRLPRFCSNIQGIQPYSGHAALGLQLLRAVTSGGAGGAGNYVAHAQLSGSTALLLSDECVYLVRARGTGAWRAEWSARLSDVIPPPTAFADKLAIYVKQDELVNYYSNDEKIIDVPDPEVLEWLKSKIEYALVIASENSRCKTNT